MKRNLVLFVASLSFALLVAEVGLRLLGSAQHRKIKAGSGLGEKAKRYGWHLPEEGFVNFVNPDTLEVTKVTLNSQKWKDVEHRIEKPKGVYRVLFLGDSVTYGIVDLKDLYSRQLQQILNEDGYKHVEILSMGVPAWGTDQALEALRLEGVSYKPDLVVYQYTTNDVLDNASPNQHTESSAIHWYKRFKYEVKGDTLRRVSLTPKTIEKKESWLKKTLLKSALVFYVNRARHKTKDLIGAYQDEIGKEDRGAHWRIAEHRRGPFSFDIKGHSTPEMDHAFKLLEGLIKSMKQTANAAGAQFAVFALRHNEPGSRVWALNVDRFKTDSEGDFILIENKRVALNRDRRFNELKKILARNKIPLIKRRQLYPRYVADPHPNAVGNRAMAEDIAVFLKKRLATPAKSALTG